MEKTGDLLIFAPSVDIFVRFWRSGILVKRQLLNVGMADGKLSLREGYT